jgi:GNAT superfamily N-acetyltransferase
MPEMKKRASRLTGGANLKMEGNPSIRRVEQRDHAPILRLARLVAAAGDAFPWEEQDEQSQEALLAETWLPQPGKHREVFVCEVEGDFVGIAGVYVLQPCGSGRCRHIAKSAYMVAPGLRGKGLGKYLCSHSLREAQKRNYAGMQFDMVVVTNVAAIKAFSSCGFKIMCTLPKVFRHPEVGLVDAHVMFHGFDANEVSSTNSVASSVPDSKDTFAYPVTRTSCTVGDEISLIPQSTASSEETCLPQSGAPGLFGHFRVSPPLPEGISLCPHTGVLRGSPTSPCEETTYHITAAAVGQVIIRVADASPCVEGSVVINEAFARQLEDVEDVADMPKEPARSRYYGDWMIWMVHRAWLNDPTLVDLNFDTMHMPLPHVELRIAPKLMKAMHTNTNIAVLSLSNSNMQRCTALELADALRQNCTVRTLNLEGNFLDSNAIRELALGIRDNCKSGLEQLRLQHQQGMGQSFGRPAEEAVGLMMQQNETLVKLGFECDDAHWRNSIDRALVRNNDFFRRRQQAASCGNSAEDSAAPAEEKTLSQMSLQASPAASVTDFYSDGSAHHGLLRAYMAQNLQLPTTVQLQHYAKNTGTPMSYTVAAPLIRQCRSWLLDSAVATEVSIVDAFGKSTSGTLQAWHESNERWTVNLCVEEGGRMTFKADREPSVFLSDAWASWLNRTKPASDGGA